jgi:hypothetical protein
MKAICYISLLLSVSFTAKLNAQNWQWAVSPTGISVGNAVCTDPTGNVYYTGFFNGQLVFGSDTINNTNGPYQDVFIAKYNATGNALWVRSGNGYADADGVATDASGNIFITGNFYNDSISFGSFTLYDPHTGAQNSNIYLVKYDPSGNVIWAKNLGGINNNLAAGISTDINGNIYVTGTFTGDSMSIDNVTVQQIGIGDAFVMKLDASGSAVWIRNIGSPNSETPTAVGTDVNGNVFMTGYFSGNYIYVGSLSSLIASPYSNNVFLIKYDSLGDKLWVKYAGGNNNGSNNTSVGLSVDPSGDVYMAGYYGDTLFLGSDTLVCPGYQNIFIAKYDPSGNVIWTKSAGGNYAEQANGISTDVNGNPYLTGFFQSDSFFFGSSVLTNTTGNEITFAAKYDMSGNPLWAIAAGGTSNNDGTGISYGNGGIYVAGQFQSSTIIFGADTLYPGLQNSFLAKLDTSAPTGIIPISKLSKKILVYPNPSSGIFYFKGVANGSMIEVYDQLGQSIYTSIADQDNYPVMLSRKEKGMYFYQITEQGNNIQQGKIVLE